jgi:DNA-binding XRE family transcriptional regulator
MPESNAVLTLLARQALRMSQRQLAELLGISERTVQRWDSKRSTPFATHMAQIAVAVHPHDPALAERIAERSGKTLEQLGVPTAKVETDATPPVPAPGPFRVPPEMTGALVDAVVCATADVLGIPPAGARPALLAALRKAAHLELTVDVMLSVLGAAATNRPGAGSMSSRRADK